MAKPEKVKQRRTVTPCKNVGKARKSGGAKKLWAFGIADIAEAAGMSEGAVRQALHRKKFDPADFKSVVEFVAHSKTWALWPWKRKTPGKLPV